MAHPSELRSAAGNGRARPTGWSGSCFGCGRWKRGSVEEGEEESGDEEEEGSGEVVAAAEESHLGILAFWRGRWSDFSWTVSVDGYGVVGLDFQTSQQAERDIGFSEKF